jgi:deoxyribose-phosphate aldolase
VAAISVPQRFVAPAKSLLAHSTVRVATVGNFPDGIGETADTVEETAAAVAAGADEVEIVFPHRAFLTGDTQTGRELVRACRRACRRPDGPAALLKITLETGLLGDAATIRRAAIDAIEAGADLIVTATGTREPGTTIQAATAILDAIAASRSKRIWAGLKVAGGIGTLSEATAYLALAERRLGGEFLGPATFRLSSPRLLDEALAALGIPG